MNIIYKIWLTLCSLLLTMTVYLVKEDVVINSMNIYVDNEWLKLHLILLPKFLSYIVYFSLVLLCTWLSMFLSKWLSEDQISPGSIVSIETANDTFLPSYLGYFFVALSISEARTFVYVFGMIFVFVLFSKISYFNPIFLIFGYKFFHLTDKSGLKIVVITKRELKVPSEVQFYKLKRINNYTFITSE